MASYTMELRDALATLLMFDGVDVSTMDTKTLIEEGRKKLFNFEYELFDPNYKAVWETNFIRNFYFREIGFETETLFQFQLESWIRVNMGFFNKLFESELMVFDPLSNSKMVSDSTKNKDTDTTIHSETDGNITKTKHQSVTGTNDTTVTETVDQTVTGTKNDTSFERDLENNTPDTRLAITTLDGAGVIEYASNIKEESGKNTSTTSNDVNGTNTNVVAGDTTNVVDGTDTDVSTVTGDTTNNVTDLETFVSTRTGKVGSITYSEMLMKYRQSLIRVENKMFAEMQQLFMLVY